MKKVLITGITGSGGSYLAEYLINNQPNLTVAGTTRTRNSVSDRNLRKVKDKVIIFDCNLCDFGSIFRIIEKFRPDVIFHLASLANVRDSFFNPISVINNNVNITLNLLEVVRSLKEIDGYNPLIQLCSTSEVYGIVDAENVPIKENCPLNPANPYATSKLTQDSLGFVYFKSFGLNIVRTRMFSYLNARRTDLFASSFAKQIVQIERGEKQVLLHGNLDSVRTLIDVRDAMESYWYSVQYGKAGEVYNIGGMNSIRVGDFLDILKKNSKVEIKSKQSVDLMRPSDVTLQIPDTAKFTKETGWAPKYSLEESLTFFLDEIRELY